MRRAQKLLALLLAVVMVFSCATTVFAAPEQISVQLDVTYGQSEARSMLDMVNDFRTGDDAWYWNKEDTAKVEFDDLNELDYDYNLEQIAMQRAAELVVYYSHIRPDGSDSLSAIPGWGSTVWGYAENIAIGQTSAEEVFTAWQETDRKYAGQGHRRNMLGENYNRIGIGHATYNGVECWVQEFTNSRASLPAATEPNDQTTTVQINVNTSNIRSLSLNSLEPLSMQLNGSAELPMVEGTMRLRGTWSAMPSATVEIMPDWTVADSSIASIENGKLVAKSAGSTTISASVAGQSVTASVTVTKTSIDNADISLSQDSWSYTGKPIEPVPTVTLNGNTLTAGTDYTVSYENNTSVGTATVIINGTGSYSGTVRKDFTITECAHQWDNGTITTPVDCESDGIRTYTCLLCGSTKTETIPSEGHKWNSGDITTPAGCETEGVRTYTCTVCSDTYTEPIAAVGHKWDDGIVQTEPSCEAAGERVYTCSVCQKERKEEIQPLGHNWDDGNITQEPSCTEPGVKTITCGRCGSSYTEPVNALGHNFGTWETVSSPTCTGQGSEQRVCERCGFTETRNIDASGHDWESDYTVDKQPTCTEDGSQSIHCSKCEAVMDTQVIPMLGHDWDNGIVTTEPSCTETGVRTYTCSRCSNTKTETVAALGHNYGEWTETKPATCTEEGEKIRTCSRCNDVETETIALLPHTWDNGVVTTESTCTMEGVKTFTCTVCSETRTESVAKAPHTPETDAAVEPTCEGAGLTEGSHCAVCGEVLTAQEVVPAKGHSWDDGVVTTDPTCTESGVRTYTCTVCGETKTESADALGHDFGEWETITSSTCTDQGSEKRTCARCGYTETRDLDVSGHTWENDYTVDKEPTCTSEGSQSIHCSKCEAVKDTQVIPALGHNWDEGTVTKTATCTETGEKTYTCSRCGDAYTEIIPMAAHTLQWVTDKEPTATEEGSRHEECTVCGWDGKTETIPVLGTEPSVTPDPDKNAADENTTAPVSTNGSGSDTKSDTNQTKNPNTGDNNPIYGYSLIAVLAVGAIAILLIARKRKA